MKRVFNNVKIKNWAPKTRVELWNGKRGEVEGSPCPHCGILCVALDDGTKAWFGPNELYDPRPDE